jgi:uncharacterized protein
MSSRLFRMMEQHARIDAALRQEQRRRGADWQRVLTLKKLKLRIKDLMHRMVTRQRLVAVR